MSGSWSLVVGCGVVLALPVLARIRQRRFDPFEPIVLFALSFGVMFVVRPATMLADGDMGFWGVALEDTLPIALLLAFVGAVAFVCGYELRIGESLADRVPSPEPVDRRAATAAALAFAAMGALAVVILLPLSDLGESWRLITGGRGEELGEIIRDSSTYLWYASWLLAPAALVLTGLALRMRSTILWSSSLVVLGVTFVVTVPLGSRLVLLPLLGGILVLAYAMRGSRPSARTLALLAVAAISLSYSLLVLRDPEERAGYRDQPARILERPDRLLYPLTRGEDAEMVAALSAALTVVPNDLGYRFGGATIGDLVTRPVPRELWSGKPLPAREQLVQHVWPQFYPGLNPAFSPLLAFYWDLGLVGVALGMGLLGVAARALYSWFVANAQSFSAQLVFAATVWFTVIAIRNDPVDTVVFALFLVVPVLAIVAVSADTGRLATLLRGSRSEPDRMRPAGSKTRDAAPL